MRLFLSEWMKTKRTAVRWITFFLPVLIACCVITYMMYRTDLSSDFIYEGFFTVWTAIIMPLGAGLLSGYLVHEEELAGCFNGLLNTQVSRTKLYFGKFFLPTFCMAACTLISALVLSLGMGLLMPDRGDSSLFLLASLFAIMGVLPILAIHLWASFLWGMGASIGIGMCGILVAALIGATSLGNKVWMFVPWAWPVKMAMFPMIFSLSSGEIIWKTAAQFITEIFLSIFTLILFLTGGILWFHKWEGGKYSE